MEWSEADGGATRGAGGAKRSDIQVGSWWPTQNDAISVTGQSIYEPSRSHNVLNDCVGNARA